MAERRVIFVAYSEGGKFYQSGDDAAPIRVYSDGWVHDDIAWKLTGKRRRERLSANDLRQIAKQAQLTD